jgi:anti-sigma-K factor RskA
VTIVDHDLHLLTGAYALDALDGPEHARFERHLAGCASCREEVRGLRETAARLAVATAIAPPPGMRARVLAAAAQTRQLAPVGRAIPGSYRAAFRAARRRLARPRPLAMIAVAAVIVALLVFQVNTWHQLHSARAQNQAVAAVLSAPDAHITTGRPSVGGTVTAVISVSHHEAVITAAGVPALSGNRVYQLWVISSSGARSAGLLPAGTAPVLASGVSTGDHLGITIEPAGGTTRPTTTPVILFPVAALPHALADPPSFLGYRPSQG